MGAKIYSQFWQPLVLKSLLRLLNHGGLHNQVTMQKYNEHLSFEDWIRLPLKYIFGTSNFQWSKALIKSFPLVGNWLAWIVGNGARVRIEGDPWVGCASHHTILEELTNSLKKQGIYHLEDVADIELSLICHEGWKKVDSLGL